MRTFKYTYNIFIWDHVKGVLYSSAALNEILSQFVKIKSV